MIFILGYLTADSDELVQFDNKSEADYNSEEWCEVEAKNLEEAIENYDVAFEAWKNKSNHYINYANL